MALSASPLSYLPPGFTDKPDHGDHCTCEQCRTPYQITVHDVCGTSARYQFHTFAELLEGYTTLRPTVPPSSQVLSENTDRSDGEWDDHAERWDFHDGLTDEERDQLAEAEADYDAEREGR